MANDDEIVHWFLANRISAEQLASYLSVQGSDVDVPEIDTCETGDPKDIDVQQDSVHPPTVEDPIFHSDDGEMGDDPDYSDGDATWVPAPAMAFDSHVELKLFLETYARKTACHINVQFKAFATKERSVKLFGHDGAWARGHAYCNFKEPGKKKDRTIRTTCTLRIPFTYDVKQRKYVVKDANFCLDHNHPVELPSSNGVRVTHQRPLTKEQASAILALGKYSLPFPMVVKMLADQFPDVTFGRPLLHRMLRTGKLRAFGGDPNAMNLLAKLGEHYREEGGVFEFDIDIDCRLQKIWLARPQGLQFAAMYNDVVQLDGGAKMNAYGFTFLPATVIDCLGKSYIVGAMAGPSAENKDDVVKTLKVFGLCRPGSVLIADEALAFGAAATHCGMLYHQCTKHYQAKIVTASAGLGHNAKTFVANANALVYHIFEAVAVIDDIIGKRRRLCRTFTCTVFTGAHSSNQRAEGTISRSRRGVSAYLERANLFEMFKHLEQIQTQQEDEASRVLSNLIRNNRDVSDYVESILRSNQLDSRLLSAVGELDSGEYTVGTQEHPEKHVVTLDDSVFGGIPSCTCTDFRSTLIPCSGICAVFSRLEDDVFSVCNIHRRWWLRLHPLYDSIRRNLRIPDAHPVARGATGPLCAGTRTGIPSDDKSGEPSVSFHDDDIYHKIVYPSRPNIRYRILSEAFARLALDAKLNEHLYRRAMSTFTSLQTEFQMYLSGAHRGPEPKVERSVVLPPLRRAANRGRRPDSVSRLSRLDRQQPPNARQPASGKRCPFFSSSNQPSVSRDCRREGPARDPDGIVPDECDSLGNDEYFEHDLLAEEPFDDDDDVFEVLGEAHQVAEVGYPEGVDGNAELNEGDLCRGASARLSNASEQVPTPIDQSFADSGTIATSSSSVNRVWATIQDPKSSFDQSLDAIRSLSYVDLSNRLQPKGVMANVNALDDAPFLMPRVIVEKCLSTEYSFPCVKITGIGVVTRKLVQTMQSVLGYKEDIVDRMDKVYKWLGMRNNLFNKPFGADIRPHVKSRHLFAHLACDEWLSDEVMNGAVDQFLGEQLEARADTPGFVQQFESIWPPLREQHPFPCQY
ncbi:unnamed protein product (mitochondrion) [Plasmodiophora brassicae]|uniref:SWIM-type domain-containing protein n=1 Tax=Plasmodiophora brassicae TaxID=37360 RepID=A0A3P3Y773_PLABS|nr:unnamed protein product [Plasmodiophora brassicae]